VLPGWLGVEFKAVERGRLEPVVVDAGAVTVTRVYGGSPAAHAGMASGDVVLGPPGGHFTERNQIREWVMTSMIDRTYDLEVLRNGRVVTLPIRISAPPTRAEVRSSRQGRRCCKSHLVFDVGTPVEVRWTTTS
jgi:S1-C subfamily serine protease